MSRSQPISTVSPAVTKPNHARDRRFLVVWAILLGGLVVAGVLSQELSQGQWFALMMFIYFGPYKISALLSLSHQERSQWTWPRLLAFFLWIGMQPRPFLPSYSASGTEPSPTWRGVVINLLTGAVFLWGIPFFFPSETPLLVRAWTGMIGVVFIRFLAIFDIWTLIFRRLGFPVEKAWVNPIAASSLRDFWGRRWNRIMSGLMRDLLFIPLSRKIGVVGATLAVFLYSGVVHEFFSVLARSGYGGPTLYFIIQGVAFLFEGTRLGQRMLQGPSMVGRCWTFLIVVGPIALVAPPAFMYEVVVPILREARVPGMSE
jgi:Membrane bound O-acyl transferase family